jgi:predicted transglutaminase-like cysteine proteinase
VLILAGVVACASQPTNRALVVRTAPRVSEFSFDSAAPLTSASAFSLWVDLTVLNAAETPALERCIADRDSCESGHLLRYRRLLELAAELEPLEQLDLVHAYFNSVQQVLPLDLSWPSLYQVAKAHTADCKGIALGKYFTLRRLGWSPGDLRVVMNWDDHELDWHALLAVRAADRTFVLDSILGLQNPRDFAYGYMVYSISENGLWDHAPDFVPVP